MVAFEFAGFVGGEPFPKAIGIWRFDARGAQKCPAREEGLIDVKGGQELVFYLAIGAAGGDDGAAREIREMPHDCRTDDAFGFAAFIARAEGNVRARLPKRAKDLLLLRIQLHVEDLLGEDVRHG